MDNIIDFIHTNLPPSLLSTLSTHTSTYFRILSTFLTIRRQFVALLNPLLTRLLHSPDIPSILLLLLILYISYQFLIAIYRGILFWVRLGLRLLLWGAIAGLAFWAYQRGPEGMVDDLSWIGREWKSEYEGYKTRDEMARVQAQMGLGGRGRRW